MQDENIAGQRGEFRGKIIGMGIFLGVMVILTVALFFKLEKNKAETELVAAKSNIEMLKADTAKMISVFNTRTSEMESELTSAKAKIDEAQADNEKLSAAMHANISKLQEELSAVKAKLNAIQPGNVRVVASNSGIKDIRTRTRPVIAANISDRVIKLSEDVELSLVHIAPGTFTMGSAPAELKRDSDEKLHQVTLTREYWIGRYEITQKQFSIIIDGISLSQFKDPYRPVEFTTWTAAMDFCRKLSESERVAGRIPPGYEYRLPTEAEWEYAARGGKQSKGFIYSGSNNLSTVGCFGKTTPAPQDIGIFSPNELGLYDMSGNVWEWCYDWFVDYVSDPVTNPVGALVGDYRVTRGGSWDCMETDCRVANRNAIAPDYKYNGLGFRVALAPIIEQPQNMLKK
jgi:formylglycine-generating enzyme required for sulfatase activity